MNLQEIERTIKAGIECHELVVLKRNGGIYTIVGCERAHDGINLFTDSGEAFRETRLRDFDVVVNQTLKTMIHPKKG